MQQHDFDVLIHVEEQIFKNGAKVQICFYLLIIEGIMGMQSLNKELIILNL
jgi:hypothetical protein